MKDPVVVVGAGPAGSACAWKLASEGIACILIEGKKFPGDKLCAGALSARGAGLLIDSGLLDSESLADHVDTSSFSMACYCKYELLCSYTSPGPPVLLINRKSFDEALFERAAAAGAEAHTFDPVVDVAPDHVRTRSGRKIQFSFLVGADGAASTVRKKVFGRPSKHPGLGLEVFVPGRIFGQADNPALEIHFGLVTYGYGWVFPRENDVCVGIGDMGGKTAAPRIAEALRELLLRVVGGDYPQLRGAVIPSGPLHPSLGHGKYYLAGDAAGLTDRVSGEGISYAIESGLLVAEAILSGSRKEMLKRASDGCLGRVRQSMRYRHLLYSPICSRRAMRSLQRNEKFSRGYWDLISGTVSYNGMMKNFLKRD